MVSCLSPSRSEVRKHHSLCLLAFVIGASPWVPPGLAFGEGQVWEEGGQGSLYLVWLAAQGMLGGAVVRTLSVETHVVGWGLTKEKALSMPLRRAHSKSNRNGSNKGCITDYCHAIIARAKAPDNAELMPANGSLIQATASALLHIMANETLQVLQGLNFFARMKVETTS